MAICKYCNVDIGDKNLLKHERFCTKNPDRTSRKKKVAEVSEKETITPKTKIIKAPVGAPKQKMFWAYKVITAIILVSVGLQYYILNYFNINLWLLVILYVIDAIIYVSLMYSIYRYRQKQDIVVFANLDDFIEKVPKWSLTETAPNKTLLGRLLKAGKEYKQLVLVSKHFESKKLWTEWNGFQFSLDNRAYKPPIGSVKGDVFFYNMDKMCPLIDTVDVTPEDAEDAFQLDAVWNQAFAVGHAAALSKTQQQIQLILLLVIGAIALIVFLGIYTYSQFGQTHQEIKAVYDMAKNTTDILRPTTGTVIYGR